MSKSKQKGTAMERLIADGLAHHLDDDRIDRSPLRGNADRGDISGVANPFGKVAIEVKNVSKMSLGQWVDESNTEAGNLDANCGVVIHKRRGKGQFLDQFVTMSVRDFLALGWGVKS